MPVTMTTVTKSYASEQSWTISGPDTVQSASFSTSTNYTQTACLAFGDYTVTLKDSYGDGWTSGSSLTITETVTGTDVFTGTLSSGSSSTSESFYLGPGPPPSVAALSPFAFTENPLPKTL